MVPACAQRSIASGDVLGTSGDNGVELDSRSKAA